MPVGARVAVEDSATANVEPWPTSLDPVFPPGRIERDAPRRSKSVLTSREREVLAMVATGRSSSSIAATLGVATSRVESHVRHRLDKLGARNRARAIALGLGDGEITRA
jgi:DNA-binding CsgD family transcriptional regulator